MFVHVYYLELRVLIPAIIIFACGNLIFAIMWYKVNVEQKVVLFIRVSTLFAGWAKNPSFGYIGYIIKMSGPIFMTFGTLQRRFMLNTSVDSVFIKFIIQSGPT